jgi:long-chain acyl-CoA synthetase
VPEQTVLVFEDRAWSRRQLDALAGGLAGRLHRRGVVAGDRVALMSSNRPEFVVALLALWRLGAAPVLLSPAWKRAEVEHALAVTHPADAVGDHPVLAALMPMLDLDEPITPLPPQTSDSVPERPRRDDADAVLVFSSGTTGLPKAVRHTHGSLAAAVRHWTRALGLTGADRIQVVTPPSHILGVLNIVTALEAGAWMRIHRRFRLDVLLHSIEQDRITIEMAVAPIAMAIASHPDLESFDLSSLRYVMWGATPVTVSVAEAVTARTGVRWLPAYGASELPVITCNPLEGARLDSVGQAVPGVTLRVVSLETGEELPVGGTGEIQARSASLMAGYLPAEETPGAFADGWYRTGDVGTIDAEGWVRLTDRSKEMIKVRGFQVAPAEIEAVLHGHPGVADCAVFGVPDEADAGNGEAIVAAVTLAPAPRPGERPTELALTELVADRLAAYKTPSRVLFVPEIPRLASGKALRRVLRDQLLQDQLLQDQLLQDQLLHDRPKEDRPEVPDDVGARWTSA